MGTPGLHTVSHQVQNQSLSPRLQRAVKMLQMSSLDYAQELTETLGRNPFLLDDVEGEPALPPALETLANPTRKPDGLPKDVALSREDHASSEEVKAHEQVIDAPLDVGNWSDAPVAHKEANSVTALDLMTNPSGLADHLHAQVRLLRLGERQYALAHAVIELLEEDGYLRLDPEVLTAPEWLDPPATAQEVLAAVATVQSLDPVGVGARSLEECLLLQVAQINDPNLETLAKRIIVEHMKLLASRDLMSLSGHLNAPYNDVDRACSAIRLLNPRPGLQYSCTDVQYIVPDVIARQHRGRWIAVLNPAVVPRMHINTRLIDLYKSCKPGSGGKLTDNLSEARWIIKNIEQRFCTIVAVAQAILDRQHLFLSYGEMGLKPLSLNEIATAVGVHESTVSRVTSNKYIATPTGVVELKHFFSRAMVMPSGTEMSGKAIRSLLKELIAEESASAPLTDLEITNLLARQGLKLARRTVTKYRQSLRIAPANLRKLQAAQDESGPISSATAKRVVI